MSDGAFHARRRVAYWECDMQGWVFHAHYVTWMDDAQLDLWRARVGRYGDFVARGFEYVVAEVGVRFREGARFEQEIEIALSVEALTTSSITTRHVFGHDGRLLAEGRVRHVCVARDGHGKVPWPDDVRAALGPAEA